MAAAPSGSASGRLSDGAHRKAGFAHKRGTSGFFAHFLKQKRFFVLEDSKGLVYAEDSDATHTNARHIDIYLSKVVLKAENALEIVTADKTYPLEFASRQERDSWFDALTAAQKERADELEALVARLERALERRASGANVAIERATSRAAHDRVVSPSQILDHFEQLTRRLEKLAA